VKKKTVKIRKKIFSGKHSEEMWDDINLARTVDQLRQALYLVCCRIQELETDIDKKENP